MGRFFNPDNWFWRGFGRLADYFLLSFCWFLTSAPIITVGTASIALYDTVAHCVRGNEGNMFKRYFTTFKRELKRGIALTVLWAVICFLLNAGYQVIVQMSGGSTGWTIFSIVYFVTLLIPLGILCWLIALESRFTYSFKDLHRTAFAFTLGYLPRTLVIVALLVVVLNVLLNFPFFVMVLPAVMVNLQSVFIEKAFAKHMPEEETEV